MTSLRGVRGALAIVGLIAMGVSNASAQVDVAVTGGIDFTNQYNFRGIRQNTEGMSIWPFVDIGIPVFMGDGGLKNVTINLGTWNAFNTQIDDFINLDGEVTSNKWYEADLYATLGLGFGSTVLSVNYTSYTSPANLFSHVKELGIKVAYDDSAALGTAALKPYALVAFELDDHQADAGHHRGTYVELGVAPGYTGARASVSVPIKLGLSGHEYYEFATDDDERFGYFSIAGIVTVPIGAHFNVHGGGELQVFGENVKNYNAFGDDGDSSTAGIASIGIGFSF
jgi:hypothetical protein